MHCLSKLAYSLLPQIPTGKQKELYRGGYVSSAGLPEPKVIFKLA